MKVVMLGLLAGSVLAGAAQAQDTKGQAISQASNGDIVFKDYPSRALAAGEHGKVGFAIRADDEGYPVACEVTSSSGFPQLDNDTCRLLMVHGSFKPVPGETRTVVNRGVVAWKIDPWLLKARQEVNAEKAKKKLPTPRWGWSNKPKAPKSVEIASASGETEICKRVPRTGSLAATDRICRTAADWAKTNEANGIWAQQQGRQGTSGGQ